MMFEVAIKNILVNHKNDMSFVDQTIISYNNNTEFTCVFDRTLSWFYIIKLKIQVMINEMLWRM